MNCLMKLMAWPHVYEPYTQFKERPYRGKYVNVDENGFRFVTESRALAS